MKKNKVGLFISTLLLGVILYSCKCPETEVQTQKEIVATEVNPEYVVADTIIYDVIIKNTDLEDMWKEKCLENLNHKAFVDTLFAWIYNEKHSAYDFFTREQLTPKDLKKLESEKGFSRDKVGKVQFYEVWYFDAQKMNMNKKVVSLVIGTENYKDSGEVKDYSPVFMINFD